MSLRNYLNGTHLVGYHEQRLKSEEVIELLTHLDIDVVYQFDRLQEGTPDTYTASSQSQGFEFRFDEKQVLDTIWCYIRPRGRFVAIDSTTIGVFIPGSHAEAKRHAQKSEKRFSESEPKPSSHVRIERESLWIHYEFTDGALSLVTLMRPWE
jgi:hypothetical protein